MGFTKLDEGILKSSIMAETPATFKVWVALLASCGYDGIARVSSVFLAATCHLSLTVIDRALQILSSPDLRSRSEADEGRRVRRVDGGFFVINYQKYRAFCYSDSPEAIRQRRHREKTRKRDIALSVTNGRDISASASASVNLIKDIEEIKRGWNEFAAKHNLAAITKIDSKSERGRHLAARMADKDWNFPKLLEAVAVSPFLLGQKGKEPFFVTFDWLLWPGNYQRTIEGNYKERRQTIEEWAKGDETK